MKCTALFCWLLILHVTTHGQTNLTDSLLQVIQHDREDSATVDSLNALSRHFWQGHKENTALIYSNSALALVEQLSIEKKIKGLQSDYQKLYHAIPESGTKFKISATEKTQIGSLKMQLQQLAQRIAEVEQQEKLLDASLKDYTMQSTAFADATVADAKSKNEILSIQQNSISRHLNDERTKRTWIVSGSIIIVLLLSLVFLQLYRRRQTKNKLEVNQLKNKVLRSQLNPHFIFNALNAVKKYIQQHPELATNYLSKFSTLMRQVLENSQEEKISLTEEIAMLENYMQLECLRVHNGFDYEVSMDHSVDAANTMIPPLIFQPILENAIWHGLDPLDRKGKIKLSFSERNDLLEAIIEDDGIGLGSASEKKIDGKKRSLGLQITRERIELLNRKAKSKGGLLQQLFEQGSKVKIAIPL
ncbi:MAG TPA: histidine kinase [Chitinophagales bacterium]|nr:histidine kinase [Chitinophagales bacterium]